VYYSWLAACGSPAATFDLRLKGSSFIDDQGKPTEGLSLSKEERREHLIKHGHDVGFEVWGTKDYPAVIAHMAERFCATDVGQRRPLALVGNSLGGHLAPLAVRALRQNRDTSKVKVDRLLTVGSTSPYSGWFPDPASQYGHWVKLINSVKREGCLDLEQAGLAGYAIPRLAALNWVSGSRRYWSNECTINMRVFIGRLWAPRKRTTLLLCQSSHRALPNGRHLPSICY
jgi:hypothetical protein